MYNQSYLEHKAALKRCESIYGIVILFYLIVGLGYVISHLYLAFLTSLIPESETMYYFLNGVVFKIPFLAFGFLGCYLKKNLYAVLALFTIGVNALIYTVGGNELISALTIIAMILTCVTNRKYHELEQCEGFPYFNERFTEVNDARLENKDVYKEQLEYHKSRAEGRSGQMDEL